MDIMDIIIQGFIKTLIIYTLIKCIEIIANELGFDAGFMVCLAGTLYFVILEKNLHK